MKYRSLVEVDKIKPTIDVPEKELVSSSIFGMDEELNELEYDSDPILMPVEHGEYEYVVVSGNRRIAVARRNGIKNVWCMVTEETLDEADYHLKSLRGNSGNPNVGSEVESVGILFHRERLSLKEICKKTGYKYWRVNNRLKLYDELNPEILEMLRTKEITVHAATLLTKFSETEQEELLKGNRKLTSKSIKQKLKDKQVKQIASYAPEADHQETIVPGLFIKPDEMQKLQNGDTIQFAYNGKLIKLSCQTP